MIKYIQGLATIIIFGLMTVIMTSIFDEVIGGFSGFNSFVIYMMIPVIGLFVLWGVVKSITGRRDFV